MHYFGNIISCIQFFFILVGKIECFSVHIFVYLILYLLRVKIVIKVLEEMRCVGNKHKSNES